jgi:hypothetical protein
MARKRRKTDDRYNKEREEQNEEDSDEDYEMSDIYDKGQREERLLDDEITAEEAAFMTGRDMKLGKTKEKWVEHDDTPSVVLAEEEYEED